MFQIVKGRFPSELEEKLNQLSEKYHTVDVQCITYDHNINQYTLVCKLGQEILPCTFYNPLIQLNIEAPTEDEIQEVPSTPKKIEWIQEKCGTNTPPETAPKYPPHDPRSWRKE